MPLMSGWVQRWAPSYLQLAPAAHLGRSSLLPVLCGCSTLPSSCQHPCPVWLAGLAGLCPRLLALLAGRWGQRSAPMC